MSGKSADLWVNGHPDNRFRPSHFVTTRQSADSTTFAQVVSSESERAGLRMFLDWQREALIKKVDGISDVQARMRPTASALSLLSIVKHSATWERRWFQVIVAGRSCPGEWPEVEDADDEATFRLDETDSIETVVAEYREQIAAANQVLSTSDLEGPCAFAPMSDRSVRWVAMHLIEETARHAGHADIIRETLDGVTGR